MKIGKKIWSYILLGFLALIIIFSIYVYSSFRNSVPLRDGEISAEALKEAVEVTIDAKGIPQIWAKNEEDAYFTMGYIHASDRLFQMDLTRRVSQGRLSELLGSALFQFDVQQRTVGHTRIAKKYLPLLSDHSKKLLKAYTKGVNHYAKSCSALPFEYFILRKEFADWTIYDCLTILSFQTWFSNMLVSKDDFFVKAIETVGVENARSFIISYPDWAPMTVPKKLMENTYRDQFINNITDRLFAGDGLPFLMAHSSNSWVVSPQKSESGKAIFSSDPHLEVERLPQFWYYLGLHIEDKGINGLGISTPGIPFIVMGHNGKAAYAFTVGGIDVADYYQEKINKNDSTQYLTPDGWKNFTVYNENIIISGQKKPQEIEIRETIHGPVMFPGDSLDSIYSLRWAGYEVDLAKSTDAGFQLITISNFEKFRKTVTAFGALDANWTYADIEGNIGYQLGTPIPVRTNDSGYFPIPGWEEDKGWAGFQPLDKTPHSYNPERGWLATCNNKQDESNLDYSLQGVFAPDRIMRITELLNSKDKFSVEDMKRFQMDTKDLFLLRWKDSIAGLLNKTENLEWEKKIRNWDGDCGVNSQAAALVNQFLYELKLLVFHDELGSLTQRVSRLWLYEIYHGVDSRWFDDIHTKDISETKEDIALSALKKAIEEVGGKTWGEMQSLTMRHPLSIVPVISGLLDLEFESFPRGGTQGTLNASFFSKDDQGYKSIVGPSWRFVMDFADPDGATMVLPAGNSGNPMSEHFKDFLPLWKSGERWNVPLTHEKVKEKTVSVLKLLPENN